MPDYWFQVLLVDKAGRRTLTLVGLGGMCCCAVAVTVGLNLQVGSPFVSTQQLQVDFNQTLTHHPAFSACRLITRG